MATFPVEVKAQAVRMVLDDGVALAAVAGELGVAVSTLRGWVSAAREGRWNQWWADRVTPSFSFLDEYGFRLTEVRAGGWQTAAVYRAERAGLTVVYSREFGRVEVNLVRASLLDLPDLSRGPVFVTGVPGQHGHLADRLLGTAHPGRKQRIAFIRGYAGLEADQVAAALAFWAGVVRDHAPEFLRGDLSILDRWEAADPRPVVTVHVPRRATTRQESAAVEKVRSILPGSEVVSRRYPPAVVE